MNSAKLKETIANIVKEESEYQVFFRKALEKAGKSITDMSDEEKKEFFNKIDSAWDGKGEKNEELVGNQHKLDIDGDGEIEASDLAALRAGKKKDESVNEEVYTQKIKFVMQNSTSSFKNLGNDFKKAGLKYNFSTTPFPHYIVEPGGNKKVAIISRKNEYDLKGSGIQYSTYIATMKESVNEEEIKWNAVENAIINFLKVNTKILDKRVQAKDTDGVKGGLNSIISGLTNAQRNLKLESVNEEMGAPVSKTKTTTYSLASGAGKETRPASALGMIGTIRLNGQNYEVKALRGSTGPIYTLIGHEKFSQNSGMPGWKYFMDKLQKLNGGKKVVFTPAKDVKLGESVNEGIGTIALGVAGGLLLLKVLKFVLKKVVGAIGMNAPLPKEKLLQVVQTMVKTVIAQSSGKQIDMLQLVALQSFLKDEINAGKITTVKQIIQVIERATKIAKSKQESVNEEEIKWNAVENAIINFLKMNTKILDKRVKDRDTDGVKGGLKSIISGLTNAQRNLKLESVNEEIKVGQMVKVVNNPHWEAALGKKGPFKRKVKGIYGDSVFFTDGSNSSMKYIKEDAAVNEYSVNKKFGSKYDIGAGSMGSGTTFWNRKEEEFGDYKKIAHVSDNGVVKFYDKTLPSNVKKHIEDYAKTQKESVNELKKLPNGNFSIKRGYNTFTDYEKNAKPGDTILKYDKRGGMIKTFVSGSELHQNAKKYLSKVHSIVGDKVNLSLFGKQGIATVPDYEKKEVGVLVLESVNEDFKSVVGKTVFSDGKGKLHFGYYKEDDSAYFVDYKTWAKLGMKDVSKGDTNKDKVINSILRNQKQFNKKVDYNMWAKKTNPSFEEKMDWFIKNGWISNITKAGIKEGVESVNEGRAFINAARKAKAEGKTEFEFNGKKYPVTLKEGTLNEMNPQLNKAVKTLLDKELKGMRQGGGNHYFAVMNVLMGALTDANFHSESKKVPALFGSKAKYEGDPMGKRDMESLYQSVGERIATMAKWDGGDIAKAIGFYVSMTIGRPMGEKIEKLV